MYRQALSALQDSLCIIQYSIVNDECTRNRNTVDGLATKLRAVTILVRKFKLHAFVMFRMHALSNSKICCSFTDGGTLGKFFFVP